MTLPAYPKYKPSGVEWLGEIPERWEARRLKFSATAIGGGTPNTNKAEYWKGDIPWVSPKDMKRPLIDSTQDYITELGVSESATSVVEPNTVLVVVRSGILRHSIPVARNVVPVALNQDMKGITVENDLIPAYLHYLIEGNQKQLLPLWSKQGCTVESIEFEIMMNAGIPLPSPDEQTTIAEYLDQKTGQIDGLIGKKKELIERLKEQRTAIITHAVTKGLDASAPMKDSGVEWLGNVPEHWDVRRVKTIGDIRYGLGEPPEYRNEGLLFIRATDVFRGKIAMNNIKRISPEDVPWNRNPALKAGEIIVVRSGAYTGDSAIIPDDLEGAIAGFDMVLSVFEGCPKFVAYALLSRYLLEAQILLARTRAAQPHLNSEELGGFVFVAPSPEEQQIIADYLDKKTGQIDGLVAKAEEAIQRLEEYRTAVITAAVTGKVKVDAASCRIANEQ